MRQSQTQRQGGGGVSVYWSVAPAISGEPWPGGTVDGTTGTVLGATTGPTYEWEIGGVGTGDTSAATFVPSAAQYSGSLTLVGDASGVPATSNALVLEPVYGLGPDALGAGMSASTVSLPAAATIVWVGYVAARDATGWMAQAAYEPAHATNRRGLVLRNAAGAPSALAFGTGGAVAIATGTLAGLDAGSLCVLVATVTGLGGTLSLTYGLAGGTPSRATAAATGSIASAAAVPGMWQAIGLGSNARTAGRGEMYVLAASLSDAAADALVTADGTEAGAVAACRALAVHASILRSGYPTPGAAAEGDTLVAGDIAGGSTWTLVDPNIYAGGLNVPV